MIGSTSTAADVVKRARQRRKMTQQALADALGIRRETVADWERGARRPARELLGPLAKALKIKIAELI
jgi:transcriptional regulator with XRE-family HTH domain